MDPRTTVSAYYDALRHGEPLGPFFADEGPDDDQFLKFGLSERLVGATEIRAGLERQTETTTDWAVTSHDLRVTGRECHAWFSDEVTMAWTDTAADRRHEFDTRWSGTLERDSGRWQFVGMHVSAPCQL